jgi:hypothetical protein
MIELSPHQAEANRTSHSLEEAYLPKVGLSPAFFAGDKCMTERSKVLNPVTGGYAAGSGTFFDYFIYHRHILLCD